MLHTLTSLALAVSTPGHGRKLSYVQILNYSPGSGVTDHANVDLDQKYMETELGTLPSGFVTAKAMYTDGAHSKPTAVCTLVSPTTAGAAIAKKAPVSFTSNYGTAASGKAYADYDATATSISFTYPVSSLQVQPSTTACYQGGLPTASQSIDGCVAGSTGTAASGLGAGESTFTIGSTTYTATCVNKGKRSLQGFSTKAQSVMYDCPVDSTVSYENGCPYTSYLPYYTYYGVHSYADTIVTAALDGIATTTLTNFNVDFTAVTDVVRVEFIKKGTAYMNAWMYAIREFEDAIDDCTVGDLTANALSSGPVHAWDEGVAFYVGSLLTYDDLLAGNLPTLDGKGKLAYTLGNKRCKNYYTCGPNGDANVGESKQNIELFDLFQMGQYELLVGNCAGVVPIKNDIVKKMTVPLVQGTLRYAYKMAHLSGGAKESAEGGIFAASVLPQVHACSASAATTIADNMALTATAVDYMAVKRAFEGCYSAMGITCADIGGLWNSATSDYYADDGSSAAPCVDASTSTDELSSGALVAIIVCAALAAILAACVLFLVCKEKSGKPIFNPMSDKPAA